MAKVPVTDDSIPHGIEGYRKYNCKCDDGTENSCLGANRIYQREYRELKRRERAAAAVDELAKRRGKTKRTATVAGSESNDSVGFMEQAVIDECATLEMARVRPFVVAAARKLARIVDALGDDTKGLAAQASTTKQIHAMLESLRPKETASKRKSGGRLATVGNLTKVKRGNNSESA